MVPKESGFNQLETASGKSNGMVIPVSYGVANIIIYNGIYSIYNAAIYTSYRSRITGSVVDGQ